jgi:hypothetical protein
MWQRVLRNKPVYLTLLKSKIDGMERVRRLRYIAEAGLGMVLAVTPVLLWIAWTPTILLAVMAVSVLSAGLLVLLTEPSREQAGGPRTPLSPEFIAEVHQLFPLTYHHSLHETTRFRRAMKRMSRLIEASGPADSARR